MRLLLDAGADVNIKNKYGTTVFDIIKNNPLLIETDVYERIKPKRFQN